MPTLEQTLETLKERRHLLAVFNYLVQHIDEELAQQDTREPGTALEADDNSPVSQEAIQEARDLLMEHHVGPLEEEIADLLGQEV